MGGGGGNKTDKCQRGEDPIKESIGGLGVAFLNDIIRTSQVEVVVYDLTGGLYM